MSTNQDYEEELKEIPNDYEEKINQSHIDIFQNQEPNQFDKHEQFQSFKTVPIHVQPEFICTSQMTEFITRMNAKVSTKNIPKTFGNYFRKYCEYKMEEMSLIYKNYELPKGVIDFILKKLNSKQSAYGLEDFRMLCQSDVDAQSLFYYYTTNFLYLDILHSNRINEPLAYINFIEQYAAGSLEPEKFISSRRYIPPILRKDICKRVNK